MLKRLGIESRLQLAVTVCVVTLIVITTFGSSGGAPPVFFIYRTALLLIAILCTIGSRESELRISRFLVAVLAVLFLIMLASVLRIPGSHFEGFYLWYRYVFFACALVALAHYSRYQSPRWKGLLLATIILLASAYLLPDLVTRLPLVVGFSPMNGDYFATFLLIALAASIASAIYALSPKWRIASAVFAAFLAFGVIRTASRGATLAAIAMFAVAAIRARERIPRQVWLLLALAGLLAMVAFSRPLITKFLDRNQADPYNYARISIWKSAVQVVAQQPLLGVGLGQFVHVSKRFSFPVEGQVARYLKRIGMAHSEYLQHMAELGVPAALIIFSLLGWLMYLVGKRSNTTWPENRCFHEAALLTGFGVGMHALVDNCWTIPVTAATVVVIALADPLPLRPRQIIRPWRPLQIASAVALIAAVYIHSVIIPGLGLYYNEMGHRAYVAGNLGDAQRLHLTALKIVPDHPVFLDNLGMVYLDEFLRTPEPRLLDQAAMYFKRAIAANPHGLESRLHMEAVLVRSLSGDTKRDAGIHEAILENDARLLEIDPYLPFPRKNLAGAYYTLGQSDRAMAELQRAIDYEPNYVPAYLVMASWYAEAGKSQQSQHYTALGVAIVNKYRDFKPTEMYERILLGRPDPSAPNIEQLH